MNRNWFERARYEATLSRMKYRVGAVLVRRHDDYALTFGHNEFHKLREEPPYSIHAEVAACTKALMMELFPYGDAELYVYRETRGGVIADSKPCRWCQQFLKVLRVDTVYYTSQNGPHFRVLTLS